MPMNPEDIKNKGWLVKRLAAYESMSEGEFRDMTIGLLNVLVSELLENATIEPSKFRREDLERLAMILSIKTDNPKE
tara:strand:+ start:216 stop:446 length:231 start_codon:yes stop_codon:yes gene_type:complete